MPITRLIAVPSMSIPGRRANTIFTLMKIHARHKFLKAPASRSSS